MKATGVGIPAHGGIHHEEIAALHLAPDEIVDFSVNVNPYGPCAEIERAVRAARIERYPDPTAAPARSSIGAWLGVPSESVIVGSGAVDVLWALARATLKPGDRVLIAEPAFSEMRSAAERAGGRIIEHRARAENDFAFDISRFDSLLRLKRPRVAYIATPANPTGALVSADVIARLAESHPSTQFVVDVSFLSLSTRPDDRIVHTSSRVLWVRSLTKELSVPGLRVGFAVGPPELIMAMEGERPPWAVSVPAQAVATAATNDEVRRFVETSRATLLQDRARIADGLASMGLRVHASETIYVIADLGSATTATVLRRNLLEHHGVLVRDASSFGLPHHVRIAARPALDADRLLSALKKELLR